jgi:hypothetical protein
MATMDVKDAGGSTVSIEKPLAPGRAAAASSRPVVLSTEDLAAIGATNETAPASDTASSGLNGRLQRIAQRLSSIISVLPTALGSNGGLKIEGVSSGQAVPVSATTGAVVDGAIATLGAKTDAKSTATDTTSVSAMSVFKQISASVQSLVSGTVLAAGTALIGRAVADASAATGGIPSTARLLSASGSSGDATNVKNSAGRLYAIQGYNASSSVRYLKLYNTSSAPTAGSGTPVKTLALPPSCGFAFDWPLGLTFSTGIGFTLVTGVADNNSSSVTAGDILGLNLDYA